MEDVSCVILGLCDCGSDYKSWGLVCKSWNATLVRKFPRANIVFGNKITTVIDELSSLEFIRNCEQARALLASNTYVPDDWKCKNGFDKYKLPEIDCTKRGSKFTSVFNRPFESHDEVIELCSKIVEDCDFNLFGERADFFHPTVSFKSIKHIGFLVHVAWYAIPLTHFHVLTDEDWDFLTTKKGVTPKFPQNINQYPINDGYFSFWCRYPTTTPDMIIDLYSKLKTLGRVTRNLNYFLVKCPTLSHEKTVDILKSVNATDDLQQYEEMWYSVLKKLHKKYDLR